MKTLSIIKLELCAAVLAVRLANLIGFHTFAAVRIGEILSCTNINDWYWTAGCNNIADWITRKKHPKDIAEQSEWQRGLDFMKNNTDNWDVKSNLIQEDLPEEIQRVSVALIQERNNLGEYNRHKQIF